MFIWNSGIVFADSWPSYRGAHHDGISTEKIRVDWATTQPRQVWKVPLDPALSSLTISGGKVLTQARRVAPDGVEHEFCLALDAETGRELWASPPLGAAFYPNGGVGNDDGPRSTPCVDGDRVYIFSSYLHLVCMDSGTGQIIWKRYLPELYNSTVIAWQNAASPVIEGDVVIVNGNSPHGTLMGFRKHDGNLAWQSQNDWMTQASPVAATIGGVRQVIFFAQSGLVSVEPKTGAVLWRYPIRCNNISIAASPVVVGETVYCSRTYGPFAGALRLKIDMADAGRAFTATALWEKPNQLMNHWATPVHVNGHLYGMYGQTFVQLKCLELATGTEKWSIEGFGYGNVLAVDGKILALSETGEIVLIEAKPEAYTELARYRALQGKCWNVPAFSDGRLYVRSTLEGVCLDFRTPGKDPEDSSPPLAPKLSFDLSRGLKISGSPGLKYRIEYIDNLTGSQPWQELQTLVLVKSEEIVSVASPVGVSHRFYRAVSIP